MNIGRSSPSFKGLYIVPNNPQSKGVIDFIKKGADIGYLETVNIGFNYKEIFNTVIVRFLDIIQMQKKYNNDFNAFVRFNLEKLAENSLANKIKNENIPFYYAKDSESFDLTRDIRKIANISDSLNGQPPAEPAYLKYHSDSEHLRH